MQEVPISDVQACLNDVVSLIVDLLFKIKALYVLVSGDNAQERNYKDPDRVSEAKHYRKQRAARENISSNLFFDPAWDILLDLYIANKEGKKMAVSAACVGLGVPASTAWRWLCKLEEEGFVMRTNDPKDKRRLFVQLTPLAHDKVKSWLQAVFP